MTSYSSLPEIEGFWRYRIFSAKTRTVPGRLEWLVISTRLSWPGLPDHESRSWVLIISTSCWSTEFELSEFLLNQNFQNYSLGIWVLTCFLVASNVHLSFRVTFSLRQGYTLSSLSHGDPPWPVWDMWVKKKWRNISEVSTSTTTDFQLSQVGPNWYAAGSPKHHCLYSWLTRISRSPSRLRVFWTSCVFNRKRDHRACFGSPCTTVPSLHLSDVPDSTASISLCPWVRRAWSRAHLQYTWGMGEIQTYCLKSLRFWHRWSLQPQLTYHDGHKLHSDGECL